MKKLVCCRSKHSVLSPRILRSRKSLEKEQSGKIASETENSTVTFVILNSMDEDCQGLLQSQLNLPVCSSEEKVTLWEKSLDGSDHTLSLGSVTSVKTRATSLTNLPCDDVNHERNRKISTLSSVKIVLNSTESLLLSNSLSPKSPGTPPCFKASTDSLSSFQKSSHGCDDTSTKHSRTNSISSIVSSVNSFLSGEGRMIDMEDPKSGRDRHETESSEVDCLSDSSRNDNNRKPVRRRVSISSLKDRLTSNSTSYLNRFPSMDAGLSLNTVKRIRSLRRNIKLPTKSVPSCDESSSNTLLNVPVRKPVRRRVSIATVAPRFFREIRQGM